MTDKEFDSIIKDALLSEEVPPQLNQALLDKVKKKKQNKIIAFTKPATYAAAVFICAVAVLGYFNSDMPLRTETASEKAKIVSEDKDISADSEIAAEKEEHPTQDSPEATLPQTAEPQNNPPVYNTQKTDVYSPKSSGSRSHYEPENKSAENNTPQSEQMITTATTISEEKHTVPGMVASVVQTKEATIESGSTDTDSLESASAVSENTADIKPYKESEKHDETPLPQRTRALPGGGDMESVHSLPDSDEEIITTESEPEAPDNLSDLFTDGYDFKSTIDERVTEQIADLPHAEEYTFTGISGNEIFSLSEENALTVNFDAGTIAPEEHGDQFFTVGTVEDGMLK